MAAPGLWGRYAAALREEPKLRVYVWGSIVDDVGVAVSGWATRLLFLALFTDQRERARLMIPTLASFLLGTLVAGPLADWAARGTAAELARWRWKVVVWGRLIETVALALLIVGAAGQPTIASVLPYSLVSAFMKTTLRPVRNAFHVDLLSRQEPQTDGAGQVLLDERGQPRMYKSHLLTFDSLTSALSSASLLVGLLLGGQIMSWASGRYVPLLLIDVATNLVFIAVIFLGCHPLRGAAQARGRDLLREPDGTGGLAGRAAAGGRRVIAELVGEIGSSFRESARFLGQRAQRPLLLVLGGSLLFEWIYEFYDAGMVVKQVLHGTDDQVRHFEVAANVAALAALAALPLLGRWVGSLGKIFLVTMLVDGLVIAGMGHLCTFGVAMLGPVALLLGGDRALTDAASTLVSLATNSASSAALRGRIAAAYAFVAIIGDIGSEMGATALSEAYGLPGMLLRIGLGQTALIAALALIGGRALWSYGLRTEASPAWAP